MLELSSDHELIIFGGPYSNLHASQAMQAEAEKLGIPASHIICTGDIVAYCAHPEETVQLFREWGIQIIAGNCEEQLAAGAADCGCGFEEGSACDQLAKGWYAYANNRVSDESRAWMRQLPSQLSFRYADHRFRVIHGGVALNNRFLFASDRQALLEELSVADCDVIIAGHAGLPFIERLPNGLWFNPGVIGMPANDGTPDCWYGRVRADADGLRMSICRLAYDHQGAAAALRQAGHVDGYAEALVTGLWPSVDVLPPTERAASGARLQEASISWRRAPELLDTAS